jgi:hypothetical protein
MSGDITMTDAGVTTIGSAKVAATELGVTAGTATASKALVVDSNKDINLGTGDLTATVITGALTGNVTGNVTGNTAGVHTGAVTGNVTGNTAGVHTGAVTGDVTGDLVGDVTGDVTGDLTGNADTATAFATGRTVGMTGDVVWTSAALDGTGNVTGTAQIQAATVAATELGVTAGAATASKALVVDSNKDINLGTGDLTATLLSGALTGNVTGNVVGDVTGDLTGNADTTTAFATGRTIGCTGDVVWTSAALDGTGNVTGTSQIQADKVGAVELGVTAGAATASKALVCDTNKDINLGTGDITATNLTGSIQTASQGNITTLGTLTGLTVGGDCTIADGSNDFDIASHDGSNGLKLGGVLITASAAEFNVLDGSTAGTAVASKALVVDANKDINLGSGDLTATNVTGTLQTAAQGNVTSVGSLNGLTIAASQTVSMGSNRITNVSDPSQAQDAATKAYVDAVKTGLDVKDSVRVATTASGTLASAFDNGSTVDGVTLATGDRIFLKNQGTASENGIYTVNASGAPTRAVDFDESSEVSGGTFTFVEEGTTNADSGWVVTNNGDVTVGTTGLTFAQFSGAGQLTAGTGMTKTGNTIDVVAGNGITANANSIQINTTWAGQAAITTLGTIASGAWQGDTVAAGYGGTGISSYSSGDIMYATGATTLSKLSKGTGGQFMKMNSGASAPEWSNELDGGTF